MSIEVSRTEEKNDELAFEYGFVFDSVKEPSQIKFHFVPNTLQREPVEFPKDEFFSLKAKAQGLSVCEYDITAKIDEDRKGITITILNGGDLMYQEVAVNIDRISKKGRFIEYIETDIDDNPVVKEIFIGSFKLDSVEILYKDNSKELITAEELGKKPKIAIFKNAYRLSENQFINHGFIKKKNEQNYFDLIINKEIRFIANNALCLGAKIIFEEGSKLKFIGSSAFKGNMQCKRIIFPSTLELIQKDAFKNCQRLWRVWVPKNCEIEDGAFNKKTEIIRYEGETPKEQPLSFIDKIKEFLKTFIVANWLTKSLKHYSGLIIELQ